MISDGRIRARRTITRPAKDMWAPLSGAATSSLSDGIGRTGSFDPGIRPVTVKTQFCGPALTVQCRAGDNAAALAAMRWIEPGDVVVLGNGGATSGALAGGNYVAMIKARGAVALVCDGPARDLDELDEVGIPIFSRGVTPAGPFKTGPGSVGFPVAIGPVTVASGDLIVGDRDGLVCVRQDDLAAAIDGYAAVREREAQMAKAIAAGGIPQWLQDKLDAIDCDLVD
jgi:4-hydroxy-4-methyl-2-oxoglutarate aldolase